MSGVTSKGEIQCLGGFRKEGVGGSVGWGRTALWMQGDG